jgi:hypothetical protein
MNSPDCEACEENQPKVRLDHPLQRLLDRQPKSTPAASTPASPGGPTVAAWRTAAERGGASASPATPPLPPLPALPGDGEPSGIPWPAPCPKCGSYEVWWDFRDRQRCQRCEARVFRRGLRVVFRGMQLRVLYGRKKAKVIGAAEAAGGVKP